MAAYKRRPTTTDYRFMKFLGKMYDQLKDGPQNLAVSEMLGSFSLDQGAGKVIRDLGYAGKDKDGKYFWKVSEPTPDMVVAIKDKLKIARTKDTSAKGKKKKRMPYGSKDIDLDTLLMKTGVSKATAEGIGMGLAGLWASAFGDETRTEPVHVAFEKINADGITPASIQRNAEEIAIQLGFLTKEPNGFKWNGQAPNNKLAKDFILALKMGGQTGSNEPNIDIELAKEIAMRFVRLNDFERAAEVLDICGSL